MPKKFDVYFPKAQGTIGEEWKGCLEQICNTVSSGLIPLKINIFIDTTDSENYSGVKDIIFSSIKTSLPSQVPAINVSVHPPQSPWKVAAEATYLDDPTARMEFRSYKGISYVKAEVGSRTELWAAGISSYDFSGDTRKAASAAFDLAIGLLESENMTAGNIVRQWNFIGNILEVKDGIQNYQAFNEVRNEYYARYRKVAGFPAATGVGMRLGEVILDLCAMSNGNDTMIRPVDNPNQVNAYNYGQQVLIGQGKGGVKHPPQFERALLILENSESILHISGTASIVGQETIGKGDVAEQTTVTIQNIMKLSSEAERMTGTGLFKSRFSFIRVYVKNEKDFEAVRQICGEHFLGIPAVYVVADICRDDLLMEIEAEAVLE